MQRLLAGEAGLKAPALGTSRGFSTGKPKLPWLKTQIQKDLEEFRKSRRSPSPPPERGVEFSDSFVADDSPTKSEQPREPEGVRSLKAAKISQVRKTLNFQPYKSTRPDLLDTLNHMVEQGLKMISSKPPANTTGVSSNEHDEEKLFMIYSTAFQVFVSESTHYQQFLSEVKAAYDAYVSSLLQELHKQNAQTTVVASHEHELQAKLAAFDAEKALEAKRLSAQLREADLRAAQAVQDRQRLEQELRVVSDQFSAARKEHDELKATCAMLTSSLTRMEEDYRNYQSQENVRGMELTSLRATEQKLNEEIDRLQLIAQNNETAMGMMVHQEVVQGLEGTIVMLREELRRMEVTHRQLLMRYAALKAAVDDSFAKLGRDSDRAPQSKDKVDDLVKDVLLGRSSGSSSPPRRGARRADPVQKVLQLVERGHAPQLVVEALLDQASQRPAADRGGAQAGPYADFAHGGAHHPAGADRAALAGLSASTAVSQPFTFSFDTEDALAASDDFKSPWTHFDGMGHEDSVPSYLRFNGKIQNLALSKRDLLAILHELWDAKSTFDAQMANLTDTNAAASNRLTDLIIETGSSRSATAEPATPGSSSRPRRRMSSNSAEGGGLISQSLLASMPLSPSFPTFVEHYLKDKFKSSVVTTEMYYNILDGLRRFAALSDCQLFLLIFEDKASFEIKDDLIGMLDQLREEAVKESRTATGNLDTAPGTGRAGSASGAANLLGTDAFMRMLRRFFPFKADQSFGKLSKALMLDAQTQGALTSSSGAGRNQINLDALLFEDGSGGRSHFLEQLRLQHLTETLGFERQVLEAIDQQAEGGDKLALGRLREAIVSADPHKPRSEVNQWLSRGCSLAVEEMLLAEARRTPVVVADFKRALRSVLLRRSPPANRK